MFFQIFFVLFGFSLGNLSPTSERIFFLFPQKINFWLNTIHAPSLTSRLGARMGCPTFEGLKEGKGPPSGEGCPSFHLEILKDEFGSNSNRFVRAPLPNNPSIPITNSNHTEGHNQNKILFFDSSILDSLVLKEGFFLVLFCEFLNFLIKSFASIRSLQIPLVVPQDTDRQSFFKISRVVKGPPSNPNLPITKTLLKWPLRFLNIFVKLGRFIRPNNLRPQTRSLHFGPFIRKLLGRVIGTQNEKIERKNRTLNKIVVKYTGERKRKLISNKVAHILLRIRAYKYFLKTSICALAQSSSLELSKILNAIKIGFLLGVFVDAFKVGS